MNEIFRHHHGGGAADDDESNPNLKKKKKRRFYGEFEFGGFLRFWCLKLLLQQYYFCLNLTGPHMLPIGKHQHCHH